MNKKVGILLLAVVFLACAAAVGLANEGMLPGNGKGEEGTPPDWAPAHGWRSGECLSRDEGDSPPPWAPAHGWRGKEEREDDDGPPPWAPAHGFRGKEEWSDNGGPPPWAMDRDCEEWGRPPSEKGAPPEWAPAHGWRGKE